MNVPDSSEKYRNCIYLEDKNCIFTYIPKVACTNFKVAIRKSMGFENFKDTAIAHSRKDSGILYLNNHPKTDSVINCVNVKKYTCVRNPFSRILSAYLNKVESRKNIVSEDYFSIVVKSIREHSKDESVSFLDFLTWLKTGPKWLTTDEHWRLQTSMLNMDIIDYNFIGRFENLAVDGQKLLDLMGIDDAFPTQEKVAFKPTNASNKLREYYTEKEIELVLDIFESDFTQLSYSKKIQDLLNEK